MNTEGKYNSIFFKLFGGGIAYRSSGQEEWIRLNESVAGGVGKKLTSFLEYLIINHSKEISSEELIDVFWPEDSSVDPGNALKYTLHKTRALLKIMFPQKENLLITHRSHYVWNPEVKVVLDVEDFEGKCMQAKRGNDEAEVTANLLLAAQLYTGDLLGNNDSEWILPIRIYYRTLYIDACKTLLSLLREQDRWMDIISVCERAYGLDPMVEDFTVFMMNALTAIGQPGRAMEQFEAYRSMLWAELSLVPSEDAEMAHTAAMEAMNTNEQDIIRLLTEVETEPSAFLCSFSAFRSIVLLEARHMARNHGESSILVVKAGRGQVSHMPPTTDVRRIERVLLKALRAGDPVARLNAGSYIVLLSGASEEDSHKVMERIERVFRTSYPRSKAYLNYRVYPLEAATAGTVQTTSPSVPAPAQVEAGADE